MSLGSEVPGSTSKAKHIMGHLWAKERGQLCYKMGIGFKEYLKCQKKCGAIYETKKMSQLWAEMGMSFREYLKCPKKGGVIYGPKKMSQLWVEMSMGFREYLKCQKKGGQHNLF
jgi:Zn ribbon nucleic-acid-binding protein